MIISQATNITPSSTMTTFAINLQFYTVCLTAPKGSLVFRIWFCFWFNWLPLKISLSEISKSIRKNAKYCHIFDIDQVCITSKVTKSKHNHKFTSDSISLRLWLIWSKNSLYDFFWMIFSKMDTIANAECSSPS